MDVDWSEVRAGIRETRRYLLAHHPPGERERCYSPNVGGRRVDLCARCSGIYPGIVLGVAVHLLGVSALSSFFLVVACPFPALLDWVHTTALGYSGSNPRRTATGALLGFGYGSGIAHVLAGTVLPTLLVGLAYGMAAVLALYGAAGRE